MIRTRRLRVRVSTAVLGCFFLKNKVVKYFSTSIPCNVKLSFYPNNYLSFTEIYITVIALRHVRQTKANDHFIDEHEDSFIINLADDSSTDESCDDYDSFTETASEGG